MRSEVISFRTLFLITLTLCIATPVAAQQKHTMIGGVVSVGMNQLSQPTDPEGAPTLLFGSAFNGVAITGGATATYDIVKAGPGFLTARGDLLLGYHRGKGFAEHRLDNFRRELVLSTLSLRIPALIGYAIVEGASRIYASAGPALLLHFATSSAVSQSEDVAVLPRTLDTTGVTHVALTGVLGYGYQTGSWQVPIELKFSWDPFVGDSTRDRFPDYRSNDDTGPYEVAFDWQVFVTIGAIKLFPQSN